VTDTASKALASLDPSSVHVPVPVGEEPELRDDGAATCRAVEYEVAPVVDTAWDASAAEKRLQAWAGVDAENPSAEAWAKYARGFAIVRGDGNKLSEFVCPHHDIEGGKFVTNKHGVSAAIAALNGGRGGAKGVSESERKAALAHLEKHAAEWHDEKPKPMRVRLPAIDLRGIRFSDVLHCA
jgi:hypothetical protein